MQTIYERNAAIAAAELAARKDSFDESDVDPELLALVLSFWDSPLITQYRQGNQKALHSLVGKVLSQRRANPETVKELVIRKLMQV